MSAGKYSFVIEQGSTVNFEIQYKDSNNNPVDLTDYSGKMQIKSGYADSNPTTYITLSSSLADDGTGLNFSNAISGSIGIYISAASSSVFTFGSAYYDLEITSGSVVTRLIEGQVRLSQQVTI